MRLTFIITVLVAPIFGWATNPSPATVLTGTQTLNGSGQTIDGGDENGYFVDSGSLNISNVTLQNFTTTGGAGSGGGAGLGGVIFINDGASATVDNVTFNANMAVGGAGGQGVTGGKLNNLKTATSNGTAGSRGDNSPSSTGIQNGGNGRNGYNGSPGGNASNGFGGLGGAGGGGDHGTITTAETIKGAAEIVKAAYETTSGTAAAALYTTISASFTAQAVAAAAGFNVGGPTTAHLVPVYTALATEFAALAADAAGDGVEAGVMGGIEAAYLVAMETTAYITSGVSGIGGPGGNGARGGNGSFGFGGGGGGNGGDGGNAVSGSISAGGPGGSGGAGGTGGFGGGGARGGNGGNGGSNGSYVGVNDSLKGGGGSGGLAGFGGGIGSNGDGSSDGVLGSAGAGYGGAIFVRSGGALTITGNTNFNNNSVEGGSSYNNGPAGNCSGTDLFMMKNSTVTINPGSGKTVTFNGTIADDSAASIATASYSTGQGAGLSILSGTVAFNGANSYTGQTAIQGGVLQALDGQNIHSNSNINLSGGILESSGVFNRFLGTASNRVQWTGSEVSSGFSARGGALLVNLNNGEKLTWGSGSFVPIGSKLRFGSDSSTDQVTFANPINLAGSTRTILVTANDEDTNHAILTGVLSNGSLTVGADNHTGVVVLAADNTYTGATRVSGGTLQLNGTLASQTVTVDSGSIFTNSSGGLSTTTALSVNGLMNLGASNTVDTLSGSGSINLNGGTLTINSGTFSGAITGTNSLYGLTKLSSGTLTLSGNSTYLGPTEVQAGTLSLTGRLPSGTIYVASGATLNDLNRGLSSSAALTNAGTLTLGDIDTISSLINTGTINGWGQTLTATTYALNSGSTINANLGSGSLTSNGTVALNGTSSASSVNVATGTMTLGSAERILDRANVTVNGTLVLGGDEKMCILQGAGTLSIQAGNVTVDRGTFSGVISGSNATFGLRKVSSGALTLLGPNSYVGVTNVDVGTLSLKGSLASTNVNIASGAFLTDSNSGLASNAVLTNAGTLTLGANDTVSTLTNTGKIDGSDYTLTATTYALQHGSVVNANLGTGTVTSTGSVLLNGASSAATVEVSNGTLSLGSAERLLDTSTVTVDGMLLLGGNEKISTLLGSGTLSSELGTLTLDNGTFSGVLSGSNATHGLRKVTTGALMLSGASTYIGATHLDAGGTTLTGSLASQTVSIASGATLNDVSSGLASLAALSNDGTLVLSANDTVSSLVNTGTINGTGYTLTASTYGLNSGSTINANLGSGSLISNGAVALNGTSLASTVNVASGTTTLGSDERLLNTADIAVDGTLVLGGSEKIGTLAGSGTLSVQQGSLTLDSGIFSGVVSGTHPTYGLTKVSSGTLTLSGDNSYVGTTELNAGSIDLTGSLASLAVNIASGSSITDAHGGLSSGAALINNGLITLGADDVVSTFVNTGTLNGSNYTLTATSYNLNQDSVIHANLGAGTLTSTGDVALNGRSSAATVAISSGTVTLGLSERLLDTANVTVNGTLLLGGAEKIGLLNGSGSLSVQQGTLSVDSGTFSGIISGTNGTYGLTKTSSGMLTLSGESTYVGITQVNTGTIDLMGSLASEIVNVASGATLNDIHAGLASHAAIAIDGTLAVSSNQVIDTLNGSGSVNLMAGLSLNQGTFAGSISGAGAISKVSTGSLTLSGRNTYTGETQIQAGRLNLTGSLASPSITVSAPATMSDVNAGLPANGVLTLLGELILLSDDAIDILNGSGNLNLGGSTLTLNQGSFSGIASGTGGLTKATTGTLTLSGANTYSGATEIQAGRVDLTGSLLSGVVTVSTGATLNDRSSGLDLQVDLQLNGTLTLGANEAIDTLTGSGSLNLGTSRLTLNQGAFSGVASGTGGLTKATTGTLTLSGSNSYTGSTLIQSGEVDLTGSLASTALTISSGATLNDSQGGLSSAAALTNNGTLILGDDETVASLINSGTINGSNYTLTSSTYDLNDGSVVHADLGAGTLSTTGSVDLYGSSAASMVNIASQSELNLMGEQLLLSTATVNVAGALNLSGGNQTIQTLNGAGEVNVNTYQFMVSGGGAFTGQIHASGTQLGGGSGTLNLTDTTVSSNDIRVADGGTINLNNSVTNTNTVTVAANSVLNVSSGTLDSAGDIEVQSSGTLAVSSGSRITAVGNVIVQESGSLSVTADSALAANLITTGDNSTFIVPDSSTLTYTELKGSGTIDSVDGIFTNNATVSGFVTFNNDFINMGNLRPGNSPGMITVGGNYTEGAQLYLQLETTTPITGHDQIRVGGNVTLLEDSILNVQAYNGIQPTRGNVYQVMANSSGEPIHISGTFSRVEFDGDGAGEGSAVQNAAVVFDAATGQIIASGLNQPTSVFADLGTNDNQRAAAQAIFDAAQIGQCQIDSDTLGGTLARQIIDIQTTSSSDLAHYTPSYYGAMAEFANIGDRALIRGVWNRVSAMNHSDNPLISKSVFVGVISHSGKGADAANVKRNDLFLGGHLFSGERFSIGGAFSKAVGSVRAELGRSSVEGFGGLIYASHELPLDLTVLATIGYSLQTHNLHRDTLNNEVSGSGKVISWTGSVGVQHRGWIRDKFLLVPRANLVYSTSRVNGFNEIGAIDALHNDGYTEKLLTGEIGLSALYKTQWLKRDLRWELLAGVEQLIARDKNDMNVHVIDAPAIAYRVKFAKRDPMRFSYGINMGYNVWRSAVLDIGYEALSGAQWDQSLNLSLSIDL